MKRKPTFKQTLACILSLLILISTLPILSVTAEETTDEPITGTTEDGFEYEIIDGEVTITGYAGENTETEIQIPEAIENLKVTTIGNFAFDNAFTDYDDFEGTGNFVSVIIPDSVTSIGDYAFRECIALSDIVIPESVRSIGEYAFYQCLYLDNINIPNSVTSIGDYAFECCYDLENITIPDSIKQIGEDILESTAYSYNDNNWYNDALYLGNILLAVTETGYYDDDYEYQLGEQLGVYEIREGTTLIADYAFARTGYTTISVPNTVTSIGTGAFSSCGYLQSINIPASATEFGDSVFSSDSLKYINVDKDNPLYSSNDGVLLNKDGTTLLLYPSGRTDSTYNVPKGVTFIGERSFSGNEYIENIILPHGTTATGASAFGLCKNLTSISLPDTLTIIGSQSFSSCKKLTEIKLPTNLEVIGKQAFAYSGLKHVDIPYGITEISENSFQYATSLKSVSIPDSVVSINDYAFYGTNLTDISIPNSVKSIGDLVFCSAPLESITIPEGVETIGSAIFYWCRNLKSIDIPSSVTLLDGTFNFSSLESINVHKNNSVYTSLDGVLFDKNITTLIAYPPSKTDTEYHIPEGVTTVNQLTYNVKTLFVPKSVTKIIESEIYELSTIYGIKGSYAETYAQENGIQFVALTELIDYDTNITVITKTDAQLRVETITDVNTIDNVNLILADEDVTALYDITLTKDGAEIQPEGSVTVKVPTGNENAKVYRVEADGTLTDMNATYIDGFMVFTTDHFSLYVLAVAKSTPAFDLGDVDKDGDINIKDATAIQKHIAMLITLDDEAIILADYDGDSEVTIKDATAIQKKIAGLI